MTLSLIILAAGRGSRFGGNKPLAEVGPAGQTLFEYSLYDAHRAGFEQIIFVVDERQDTSKIRERLTAYSDALDVSFVTQSTGDASRSKPWGTAHAMLQCMGDVKNPFVVINADDYYGQSNFVEAARFLQQHHSDPMAALMPGYRLENTMSDSGGVNRGICSVSEEGYLLAIQELKDIRSENAGYVHAGLGDSHDVLQKDTIVSMNFWGFNPAIFPFFKHAFNQFLGNKNCCASAEFYIPEVVNAAIQSDLAKVTVFPTTEKWKGLTYAEDLPEVRGYLLALTKA